MEQGTLIYEMLEMLKKQIEKPSVFEYLSVVLSIIAIVISVLAIFYQIKLNNTNLQSVYFEEIFGSYLKNKIPKVMEKLEFDERGKLSQGYREINKTFMAMIRGCGYFKYAKNDFYYELTSKTKALDEHLVEIAGKQIKDREEQKVIKLSVHKEVQDIVYLINKNYQRF